MGFSPLMTRDYATDETELSEKGRKRSHRELGGFEGEEVRGQSGGPVFERKSPHALEFADIVGDENEPEAQRLGGDNQVIGANRRSRPLELRAQAAVMVRSLGFDGQDRN